ncbi:hypothetical protein ASE21_19500 [Flavobacterium sp. Root901]|uniref:phosphoribosyltransferase-like protein n=1 Tax=Flavobacterium sp. Root901 TaxID=1736605 RepID=UPI00070EF4D0|nr:hypothetical protein [Flavobacterium sp. Root901]KRD06355.1 hypothetical protein ASE21_19500 [Flavobacterium sp. Root901]
MEKLIQEIVEIIKDYRKEDLGIFYQTEVNEKHVKTWVEQFKEEDREFLLEELLHLLPNSYLTKENTLEILGKEFETLRKDFGYDSVQAFLDETRFLDCQEIEKSQKVFLSFIDEILQEKYDYSINECGNKEIKNWLYLDDILASGGTFREDILEEIKNYGNEKFLASGIRIIASFVILHSWASNNVRYAIDTKLNNRLNNRLKFYRVVEIENNPKISFYNYNPDYNHIYPIKSVLGEEILEFIESAFERNYGMGNEQYAFRDSAYPKAENFFSSAERRIRYENILLEKGFEIIKSIDHLTAPSLRPLGMTPPSYKTLGTGSHFFTWRNISNTCPIVFWWGANDWYPLFPVKNRGNH